jgi:hypothetical protein
MKRRSLMRRVLVVLGVLTFAAVAYASNWKAYWKGTMPTQPKCDVVVMVDLSSGWDRITFGPNHAACPKESHKDIRSLSKYDCASRVMCTLSESVIDWQDNSSNTDFDGSDCSRVAPDTFGETMFNHHCLLP